MITSFEITTAAAGTGWLTVRPWRRKPARPGRRPARTVRLIPPVVDGVALGWCE